MKHARTGDSMRIGLSESREEVNGWLMRIYLSLLICSFFCFVAAVLLKMLRRLVWAALGVVVLAFHRQGKMSVFGFSLAFDASNIYIEVACRNET